MNGIVPHLEMAQDKNNTVSLTGHDGCDYHHHTIKQASVCMSLSIRVYRRRYEGEETEYNEIYFL